MIPVGLETLVSRVNACETEAASELSEVLPQLADEQSFRALSHLTSPRLRQQASAALARLGVDAIWPVVRSAELQERLLGLAAAGWLESLAPGLVACLLEDLTDVRPAVSDAAARALGQLALRHEDVCREVLNYAGKGSLLPALVLLLDTQPVAHRQVVAAMQSERQPAVRALAEADPFPAGGVELLEAVLQDRSEALGSLALAGLTRAAEVHADAVWALRACAVDPLHPLRLKALRGLAQGVGESVAATRTVDTLVDETDTPGRMALTLGLSSRLRSHWQPALAALAQVAARGEPDVVATAVDVLAGEVGDQADQALGLVHDLLAAPHAAPLLGGLADVEGPCGRLASGFVRLWQAETDLDRALADFIQDIRGAGEGGAIYPLLWKLGHWNSVDEMLASAANLRLALHSCPAYLVDSVDWLWQWLDRLSRFETQTDPEAQSHTIQQSLQELAAWREGLSARGMPLAGYLGLVATHWKTLVLQTLFSNRRGASLVLSVAERQIRAGTASRITLAVHNEGPGTAYHVMPDMRPSPDYSIQMGSHHLATLGPHETETLDFVFTPQRAAFRVEFQARYSDFSDAECVSHCEEDILPSPGGVFTPIPNPYMPGLPLDVGSELFLGREDVFRFVEQNLLGVQKRVLVLVGQRRMGKTSILKQLPLRLPTDIVPVFIDCQGLEHHGLGNLLYHMCYIIGDVVHEQRIDVPIPDLASFQERPLFTFEYSFIKPVSAALGERTLLLLVDEFQALDEAVEAGQLAATDFSFFRSLMQHHRQLCFLFSGLQKPVEQARDYWQPVFNVAMRREVGLLEKDYAQQLIEKPVAGHVSYDASARDELLRLSCGHPYLTQLFCDRLVNQLNSVHENVVRVQHIHQVIPEVFSAGVNHFYSLWEDLSSREKIVLIAISATLVQNQFATLSAITRYIRERGIDAELGQLTTVLQQLLGHDMISYANSQPPGYTFRVLLFRLWVEKEMLHALVGAKIRWD